MGGKLLNSRGFFLQFEVPVPFFEYFTHLEVVTAQIHSPFDIQTVQLNAIAFIKGVIQKYKEGIIITLSHLFDKVFLTRVFRSQRYCIDVH